MSKKRLSQDSSIDGKKNEDSHSEFQQDDSAKRAKLVLLSDTTLQDLPIELLECILIKAVVMEVKALKLAKCAWKEKADQVIARLGTVCSQWSSTLATNFFRKELHRTLDDIAQGTIRLEVLHQCQLPYFGPYMRLQCTTIKDEMFLLCTSSDHQDGFINVYDRRNTAKVTDVIPLPGLHPEAIAGCSVSNCVYIMNRKLYDRFSILRLVRDGDEHWSTVSPSTVISDLCLPKFTLSVSANGSIILSRKQSSQRDAISVFDASGALQQKIRVPSDIYWIEKIIPKSNGNLVYVSVNRYGERDFTEISMNGDIIRQYQSAVGSWIFQYIEPWDKYGRLLISDLDDGMKLLDSEFNLLDFTGSQFDGFDLSPAFAFHYNCERDELVSVILDQNTWNGTLTIFQLKEL